MEFNEVIMSRRSIRKYKNTPVEKSKIKEIIKAAIYAPSWKNSQTARYHVISNPDILVKLKETCLPEFNARNAQDAPVLIVTSFIKNRSGYERSGEPSNELENHWGAYDLGLHNQTLCLKATELGLATLIMGIRDADKINALLQIPENECVVAVIAVGYKDISPEMPKRKDVEDITKFY